MEMKICGRCKIQKSISDFGKNKGTKNGLQSSCRVCKSEQDREYRAKNKDKIIARGKKYYQDNKEEFSRKYKEYYRENSDKVKAKVKKYRENNPKVIKERKKKYYEDNKAAIFEKARLRDNERRRTDMQYRLLRTLRARTYKAFAGMSKESTTIELLGVSIDVAKKHIEKQFTKGMDWCNFGEWHIDHKIPLASAKTKEELGKLCHYTNLQPMWGYENLSKGSKIINGTQISIKI
jgi:hypothetical protein